MLTYNEENDAEAGKERSEVKEMVVSKLKEMKVIFAAKEDRVIENYEQIVKVKEFPLIFDAHKWVGWLITNFFQRMN